MADDVTQGSSPRWMRWILVVSLALNLLIAGVVGGWVLKGGKQDHHHAARFDQLAGPLTRALSKEDRRAIGREMRQALRDSGTDREAQKASLQNLITALRSDPFDRDTVARHLATQRAMMGERVELGQTLLVDRLSQMDVAARAGFADRLEEAMHRRKAKRAE